MQPPLREAFLFIAIDGNDQLVEVPASRIFGVMSGKVNVMKAPETAACPDVSGLQANINTAESKIQLHATSKYKYSRKAKAENQGKYKISRKTNRKSYKIFI